MRNRGKREVEEYYNNGGGIDGYGEGYVEFPCKKHPSSSSSTSRGGICAFCLTDRLYQLVCPQCGEQRLSSSCSCSCTATTNTDLFSSNNANSSSFADVGNVGRISFLLENDKVINSNYAADISIAKPKIEQRLSSSHVDDFATLKRSNSTCVGLGYVNPTTVDRKESKDKFWKIGRLFRKKREKTNNSNYNNSHIINSNNNNDEENINNYECNGVSRSRSLCSFRGFYDTEESGNFPVSTSAARASSVSTGNFYADSAKMSCFSESEARFSNFDYFDANGFNKNNYNNYSNNNNNIYSLKESEFMSSDDPAYIDLKLDGMSLSSDHHHHHAKRVPDLAAMRRSGLGMSTKEFSYRGGNHDNHEMLRSGSCRRSSVTERELRNCRKSSKVWRWFFRHQSSSSANHDDDHHHFNN